MHFRARSVGVTVAAVLLVACGKKEEGAGAGAAPTPVPAPAVEDEVTAEGSAGLHHSSPWEWGPQITVTVPVGLKTSRAVLQPMGSYTRLMYDGGHEDRFEIGAQGRYSLASKPTDMQFWVGAEVAYAWLKDHYDGGSGSYDGPSATLLFGAPLARTPLNPTIVGGVGVTKYSNTGVNLRLGLQVSPFNR